MVTLDDEPSTIMFHDDDDNESFITIFADDEEEDKLNHNELVIPDLLGSSSCSSSDSSSFCAGVVGSIATCNDSHAEEDWKETTTEATEASTVETIASEASSNKDSTDPVLVVANKSEDKNKNPINGSLATTENNFTNKKQVKAKTKLTREGINLRLHVSKQLFTKAMCPKSGMNHDERLQVSTFLFQVSQDSIKITQQVGKIKKKEKKKSTVDNRGLQVLQQAIQLQKSILEETMQDLVLQLTRVVQHLGKEVVELTLVAAKANSTSLTSTTAVPYINTLKLSCGKHNVRSINKTLERKRSRYQTLYGMLQLLYASPSLSSLLPEIGNLLLALQASQRRHGRRRTQKLQQASTKSFSQSSSSDNDNKSKNNNNKKGKQDDAKPQGERDNSGDSQDNVVDYQVVLEKLTQAAHEAVLKQNMEQTMMALTKKDGGEKEEGKDENEDDDDGISEGILYELSVDSRGVAKVSCPL